MTTNPTDSTLDDILAATATEQAPEGAAGSAEPVQSPEEKIAALEAEVAQLKNDYLRALADTQNAKRMAQKQIEDNSKYAMSNFAKELLPVADNLTRALMAAPEAARAASTDLNTLAVGVEMTEKELQNALGKYGVRRIDSLNQPFNPHHHQAMQEVDRTDIPSGTVVMVYQDGYLIQDRLLRPAMVVVSKGGPARAPEADTPSAAGVNQTV